MNALKELALAEIIQAEETINKSKTNVLLFIHVALRTYPQSYTKLN